MYNIEELFYFGPAASVSTINVVNLTSNSVKVEWSSENQSCADGFAIKYESYNPGSALDHKTFYGPNQLCVER